MTTSRSNFCPFGRRNLCQLLPGEVVNFQKFVPALIITGTEDIAVPAANFLIIAQKIPGSWLVQIQGAGHGLMYQYPDKLSKVLQTFLSLTNTMPAS